MEIVNHIVIEKELNEKTSESVHDEQLLYAATTAAAIYGFIQTWLTKDIDKTPAELVQILKKVLRNNVFL